jgi:aspartyl/glutamyl-tRNA(Asn/Gln) amidotransferase C subunit
MISLQEILALAGLARLKVSDTEAASLQTDFSTILDYVGQVNAVSGDAAQEVPAHHNIMRDDTQYAGRDYVAMIGKREALLEAFPDEENGYNVVRKIIQKED